MKKLALKVSLTAIVILANGVSFAQTREERIKFERGKSSATVAGMLSAGQVRTYVLYVKKGQKITVRVNSAGGKVDVDGANISAGQFEEPGGKSFNVPIDQTGDYQVYVRNAGKTTARFTLIIRHYRN